MNNTALQNATIQEIKDIADRITGKDLIHSADIIAHCYERGNLDEEDIYNLMRNVISIVSDINNLKDEIALLKIEENN